MKFVRAAAFSLAFMSNMALSREVRAQPTQAQVDEARAFLKEGRDQLQAGQFARAVPLLEKAHQIMHVPQTGFDLMQAYAGVDKLVEAREIGEEIQSLPVKQNEPAAATEARAKVVEGIGVLDRMIPTILLRVAGPPISLVKACVDERSLTTAQMEKPYRVNVGSHRIVVTAEGYYEKEILLPIESQEAKEYPIDITLRPLVPPSPPPPRPLSPVAPQKTNRYLVAGLVTTGTLAAGTIGTGIAAAITYQKTLEAYHRDVCAGDCDADVARRAPVLKGLMISTTVLSAATLGMCITTLLIYRNSASSERRTGVSLAVTPMPGAVILHGRW